VYKYCYNAVLSWKANKSDLGWADSAMHILLSYVCMLSVECLLVIISLFTGNDVQTIEFCHLQFNVKLPNEQVGYRCKKFASSEFVSMLI